MVDNTLFVMSGLPRSGKSTWARENANELSTTPLGCPIVSGDAVRRCLYERRFWMPGDRLVGAYMWVMVRALFVAGHKEVIVDETNWNATAIDAWKCNPLTARNLQGGSDYPPFLDVDKMKRSQKPEETIANELQGDVVHWRRKVIVVSTDVSTCLNRLEQLQDYNQRTRSRTS